MSSFLEQVNASIPNLETVKEKEKRNKILGYKKDAKVTADMIRKRIIQIASQHRSNEVFTYEGMLFSKDVFTKSEIEKTTKNSWLGNSFKTEKEIAIFLKEEAKEFYTALENELKNDCICISEWQIASIFYPDDDVDYAPSFLSDFKIPLSNMFAYKQYIYLFDKWRPDEKEFRVDKGPCAFDAILKIRIKEKTVNGFTKSTDVKTIYKDMVFNKLFNIHTCISINFSNN